MIYGITIVCTLINYCLYVLCGKENREVKEKSFSKKLIPSTGKKQLALLISLIFAFCFVHLFYYYGYGPIKIIKYCSLIGGLVPIAAKDIEVKIIPNRWLLYLIGIRLVLFAAEAMLYPSVFLSNLIFTLLGGIVSGGIFYLAYVISRQGIGLGDVKLFMVIGIYLGTSLTYMVILASLMLAAGYGILNLIRKRIKVRDEIAFAPFVLLGTILMLGLGF